MSNFPLSYRLSWLPRFLTPSLAGRAGAPLTDRWLAPAKSVRLVFLGDVSAVASRKQPEIDRALRSIICSADLVVANCESPVVARSGFPIATRIGTRHAMTPGFLDGVIEAVGIDSKKLVLSLANNHAFDQGVAGFEGTVSALAERGIRTVGTLADGLVRRVDAGPLTVGLLAFTQWRNAGEAAFSGRVAMPGDLADWRGVGGVDLLCVIPHWDYEFRHFPHVDTRRLARSLVDSGAGLIVGHHAHVVQPAERIGDAFVAYGLGDFLGTALPRQPWPGRIGMILDVDISADPDTRGKIAGYRFHPFLRTMQRGRERLTPIDTVEGPIGGKAWARLAAIFGE